MLPKIILGTLLLGQCPALARSSSVDILPPTITPSCAGAAAAAGFSWTEAGRGHSGYIIDVDNDADWNNGFWDKVAPPVSLMTLGPDGFAPRMRGAGRLVFRAGIGYRMRVYYVATGEYSLEVDFIAARCGGEESDGEESRAPKLPSLSLRHTFSFELPYGLDAGVDSNSPVHWDGNTVHVLTSSQHPYRSSGSNLYSLSRPAERVEFDNTVNGGRWIEATHTADNGLLYGWYHNEPAGICPGRSDLTAPRIGAVVSADNGASWKDLGIILEAPEGSVDCQTPNKYFAGGNGDFSVLPDAKKEYLYFFISSYPRDVSQQGVAVARMRYADKDQPVVRVRDEGQERLVSKVEKWHEGKWEAPGLAGQVSPILRGFEDWHQRHADAFWGPSIHWNTYLNLYVMLLNRAKDSDWNQEGIYALFSRDLSDPRGWFGLMRLLSGGGWYPQVISLAEGGTDKLVGKIARFFMSGQSRWEAVFETPAAPRRRFPPSPEQPIPPGSEVVRRPAGASPSP